MFTALRGCFIASAALVALGFASLGANADSAADFYKGKTVRLIVGYGPGGGYDAYARMLAPQIAKRLDATVIVENRPGGGGLNALSALVREPGDGLRIQLLNAESAVLAQAIGRAENRFDLRKLTFLGRVSYENRTLLGRKDTAYNKIDAFLKSPKPIHFGTGGRTDSLGAPASLFCHAFNLSCKLITGYKGAADVALAVQRGELDAMVTSESQSAQLVKSGPLVPVAILSPNAAPLLPGVPTIFKLLKLTPEQEKWMGFNAQMAALGRSLIVPGDTPADRARFLTSVVDRVLTDPDVRAEGARTNRPIDYASGPDTRRTLDRFFGGLDQATTEKLKQVLLTAY